MYMYMHFDLCKIHREVQKHPGNDHLTSPLHPRGFLVPYLEIDEWVLNFIPYVKVMYDKIGKKFHHTGKIKFPENLHQNLTNINSNERAYEN